MKTTASIVLTFSLALSALYAQDDSPGAPEMKKLAKDAVVLGWKYFHDGNYETALSRFEMAARHDKAFAPAYFGMAYVYSVQGKLDDAIKYYRESLKYDQTYPSTFANLGCALLQKKQFDEARKMLDKALQLDPKCGEAHLSYANYYAQNKNWKKAEESANKAIECGQKLHPEFRKLLEENGAKLRAEQGGAANESFILGGEPTRDGGLSVHLLPDRVAKLSGGHGGFTVTDPATQKPGNTYAKPKELLAYFQKLPTPVQHNGIWVVTTHPDSYSDSEQAKLKELISLCTAKDIPIYTCRASELPNGWKRTK